MDSKTLIGLIVLAVAAAALMVFLYFFLVSRGRREVRTLMGQVPEGAGSSQRVREMLESDEDGTAFDRFKTDTKRNVRGKRKKVKPTLDERFFQAGIFTERDKKEFQRMCYLLPFFSGPIIGGMMWYTGSDFMMIALAGAVGAAAGVKLPVMMLGRRVKYRHDEILYYLPLVIEQIAIGVSSSLDIGPCVQRVVAMADERDTHNVVTELMRHVQFSVKSGVSLEHALSVVGKASGSPELKHAFMALSQVAKHGGEISRQLQELADSVSAQRETKIDAKIKRLELEATAPVALVFAGFLVIILVGFGLQLKGAL